MLAKFQKMLSKRFVTTQLLYFMISRSTTQTEQTHKRTAKATHVSLMRVKRILKNIVVQTKSSNLTEEVVRFQQITQLNSKKSRRSITTNMIKFMKRLRDRLVTNLSLKVQRKRKRLVKVTLSNLISRNYKRLIYREVMEVIWHFFRSKAKSLHLQRHH